MRILGLDEAGRGSVLGPLVVGAFAWEAPAGCDLRDLPSQAPLREAGADDSKALRPARRDQVRAILSTLGEGRVRRVEAGDIDQGNVNDLEEAAFLDLVRDLRPARVYLDAPVHPRGVPALCARLLRGLAGGDLPPPALVVEPKADATWPVVGAASIFAKVARDEAMRALSAQHGRDLGSGYPSDPKSRRWLAELLAASAPLPACVRQRWATLDVLRQQALF